MRGLGLVSLQTFEAEKLLTMRREEKENFRFVSPMMMAISKYYAEIIEEIRNECDANVAEWPLCLECPAIRGEW